MNKTYPAVFKALDDQRGIFSALVSVFGNVDLIGDRVVKGAFANSLAEWQKSGDPIPIVWSHQWDNPAAHIGWADPTDVMETDAGLEISKGQLDMDNPFAAQVYRLMKQRRVREFSFAYDVLEEHRAKDGANDLQELTLIEAGPTLKGLNPSTELITVKGGAGVASDDSAWDKGVALGACNSAADYRSICAGEHEAGTPDERQHWALPHHYLGKPANAAGVSAARARFDQTQDLTNRDAARRHLYETHKLPSEVSQSRGAEVKEGRRNSTDDLTSLQAIHDALVNLGVSCEAAEDPQGKAAPRKALFEADLLDLVG